MASRPPEPDIPPVDPAEPEQPTPPDPVVSGVSARGDVMPNAASDN
ncbi:hypothetical protein ACFQPG_10075 [Sphingomonas sp. GCM10030256]